MSEKSGKIFRFVFFAAEILLFLAAGLLLTAFVWIVWTFNVVSIEVIMVHLAVPLTGVDMRYIINASLFVLLAVAVAALYGVGLVRAWRRNGTAGKRRAWAKWALALLPPMLLAGTVFAVERTYSAFGFFFPDREFSTFFDDNFARVSVDEVRFKRGKNNLVLVFLESAEDTLNDKALFGDMLMPRLAAMQKENIHFVGFRDTLGTGYSLAGVGSFLMGFPTLVPPEMTTVGWPDNFYPDATSVLDILEGHGYHVDAILGTHANFGGYRGMYSDHGSRYEIMDIRYFKERRNDWEDKVGMHWGLPDSYIYARARERIREWDASESYLMTIKTVNTHTGGLVEDGLVTQWDDFRDTFLQADQMLADFIEWVQKQDGAERTTVVVVGDHLYPGAMLGPVTLPPRNGRNLFNLIVNPVAPPERFRTDRVFASWDFAPTILECLGADIPGGRLGLGTSLLRNEPTLLEKVGHEEYERKIAKRSRLYNALFFDNRKVGREISKTFD